MGMVGRNLKPAESKPETPAAPAAITEVVSPGVESADKLGADTTGPAALQEAGQDDLVKSEGNTRERDATTRLQQEIIAVQYCGPKAEDHPVIVRRPHGRALPK